MDAGTSDHGPTGQYRSGKDDRTAAGRGVRAATVLLPAALGAAGLFFASLSPKGSAAFYAATFCVAGVYFSAWLLLGRPRADLTGSAPGKDLATGLGLGVVLLALFAVGAVVVAEVPVLADPVRGLLENLRVGSLPATVLTTAVNGVAEEAFFRGTVPRRLSGGRRRRALLSVGLYALVTAAMGVPLLVLAAVVLGALAQWVSWRTGALLAPIALHLVWGLGMLAVLPPLVGA